MVGHDEPVLALYHIRRVLLLTLVPEKNAALVARRVGGLPLEKTSINQQEGGGEVHIKLKNISINQQKSSKRTRILPFIFSRSRV